MYLYAVRIDWGSANNELEAKSVSVFTTGEGNKGVALKGLEELLSGKKFYLVDSADKEHPAKQLSLEEDVKRYQTLIITKNSLTGEYIQRTELRKNIVAYQTKAHEDLLFFESNSPYFKPVLELGFIMGAKRALCIGHVAYTQFISNQKQKEVLIEKQQQEGEDAYLDGFLRRGCVM